MKVRKKSLLRTAIFLLKKNKTEALIELRRTGIQLSPNNANLDSSNSWIFEVV